MRVRDGLPPTHRGNGRYYSVGIIERAKVHVKGLYPVGPTPCPLRTLVPPSSSATNVAQGWFLMSAVDPKRTLGHSTTGSTFARPYYGATTTNAWSAELLAALLKRTSAFRHTVLARSGIRSRNRSSYGKRFSYDVRGAWIERPRRRHDPTSCRKDHRIGEARFKKSERVALRRDQGIWVITPPAASQPG